MNPAVRIAVLLTVFAILAVGYLAAARDRPDRTTLAVRTTATPVNTPSSAIFPELSPERP